MATSRFQTYIRHNNQVADLLLADRRRSFGHNYGSYYALSFDRNKSSKNDLWLQKYMTATITQVLTMRFGKTRRDKRNRQRQEIQEKKT